MKNCWVKAASIISDSRMLCSFAVCNHEGSESPSQVQHEDPLLGEQFHAKQIACVLEHLSKCQARRDIMSTTASASGELVMTDEAQ